MEQGAEVFKFHYQYSKSKPYQVSCRLTNLSGKDLYFCVRNTPWDEISNVWEIKSLIGRSKGEKATYVGKEITHKRFGKGKKRLEHDRDPASWVKLSASKSAKKEFTLRYQLPFGGKSYGVRLKIKEIEICDSKELGEDGRLIGIRKAKLKVTKKVLK